MWLREEAANRFSSTSTNLKNKTKLKSRLHSFFRYLQTLEWHSVARNSSQGPEVVDWKWSLVSSLQLEEAARASSSAAIVAASCADTVGRVLIA